VRTAKWAVTMTKVRIRRVLARTRWQLVSFVGVCGGESRGIVDMIAVRKDHQRIERGLKRGDALELVLIQVKGGGAAAPTSDDAARMRVVARLHGARSVLLARWTKGAQARFYELSLWGRGSEPVWSEIERIEDIFR